MGWAELAATTLENDHVRLRPIVPDDREALHALAMDPDIWRFFAARVERADDLEAFFVWFFDGAIADQAAGLRTAYQITDKRSGRPAGSMSLGNMAEADRRIEIGWSWLGSDFRGQGINRWAKFLMMEHAFERMDAERVEFKTDALNERARHGLRNIGATEEGTLRSFNPMPDGRRRDAVFYSVLRAEWPSVRQQLLARPKATPAGASG
jgi:RimJ/RimL family protein N-acetyltransferase